MSNCECLPLAPPWREHHGLQWQGRGRENNGFRAAGIGLQQRGQARVPPGHRPARQCGRWTRARTWWRHSTRCNWMISEGTDEKGQAQPQGCLPRQQRVWGTRGVADQGTAGNGTRTETRRRPLLTFNAWAGNTSLWGEGGWGGYLTRRRRRNGSKLSLLS